jgi:hypothetical protein
MITSNSAFLEVGGMFVLHIAFCIVKKMELSHPCCQRAWTAAPKQKDHRLGKHFLQEHQLNIKQV